MNNPNSTKLAAVKMLKTGIASPSEIASLANVSRQLVHYWANGVNWHAARSKFLTNGFHKMVARIERQKI